MMSASEVVLIQSAACLNSLRDLSSSSCLDLLVRQHPCGGCLLRLYHTLLCNQSLRGPVVWRIRVLAL